MGTPVSPPLSQLPTETPEIARRRSAGIHLPIHIARATIIPQTRVPTITIPQTGAVQVPTADIPRLRPQIAHLLIIAVLLPPPAHALMEVAVAVHLEGAEAEDNTPYGMSLRNLINPKLIIV